MGQKVIIRFWWEFGLSSASRNHLTTFCRPYVHYACLRLYSLTFTLSKTIVFILSGTADYSVWHSWSAQTSPKCWCGKHE